VRELQIEWTIYKSSGRIEKLSGRIANQVGELKNRMGKKKKRRGKKKKGGEEMPPPPLQKNPKQLIFN